MVLGVPILKHFRVNVWEDVPEQLEKGQHSCRGECFGHNDIFHKL